MHSMDDDICYCNIMLTRYLKFFGSINHCFSPSAWAVHELCLMNIEGKHDSPVYKINMSCLMLHARKVQASHWCVIQTNSML